MCSDDSITHRRLGSVHLVRSFYLDTVRSEHCLTLTPCSESKTRQRMAGIDWVHVKKNLNVNDLCHPLAYSHLLGFVLKINT